MRNIAAIILVPSLLLAGCDSCKETPSAPTGEPGSPSSSSAATATPSAPPSAAPSAALAPSGKMAHCPDAVPGAKTTIADVPGGVELSIAATDPAAVADVRARTKALLDAQKNQGGDIRHTGTGEGGGLLGRCPVVLKDTTVTALDTPAGSKLTVLTKNAQEVDWLRRETRERQEDLESAGAAPAGSGKMSHCPSAARGAVTALKNTPQGVTVTVTGSGDDVVKDIRDRAKHLADIANSVAEAGAEASHAGGGGGGGTVGRCPVVIKDTTIKIKDVAGGSQIDVKAKAPADVNKLQAEAQERAAKFQLPGGPGDASAPAAASGSGARPAAPAH